MTFRKEEKFKVSITGLNQIRTKLLLLGMKSIHYKRHINSIYFDNSKKQMFQDSEEGILPRKKIRIRWYNCEKIYTKETKISSLEGRFKLTEAYDKDLSKINNNCLILFDSVYGTIKPVIKISYLRSYFLYKSIRVTFDENIIYKDLSINNKIINFDNECVVEFKMPLLLVDDDYVKNLLGLNSDRFSKYCRGVLRINGSR